jgi:hypothetical protein
LPGQPDIVECDDSTYWIKQRLDGLKEIAALVIGKMMKQRGDLDQIKCPALLSQVGRRIAN